MGVEEGAPSPLRRERVRRGLTQEQLARRIGADKTTVSRWERGVGRPGIHHRNRLSEALGLDLAQLDGLLTAGAAPETPGARTRLVAVVAVVALALLAALTVGGLADRLGWGRSDSRAAAAPPIACTTAEPCSFQVEVGQNLCLDYAVARGTVEIWPCWNGKGQRWFQDREGQRFTLRTVQAPGRCVSAAAPDQQLTMGECSGPGVWWTMAQNRDGSYALRSAAYGGTCLTDSGGGVALRTPVVLSACGGRPEQRWIGLRGGVTATGG